MKTIPITPAGGEANLGGAETGFAATRLPRPEPLETPAPPAQASAADRAACAALLARFLAAMRAYGVGAGRGPRLALGNLGTSARALLNDSLGQGEVSVLVRGAAGAPGWRIQETAFAGVWRVQRARPDGALDEDLLEAGDLPAAVKSAAARQPSAAALDPALLPEGVMNAPALVNEIRYHARRCGEPRPAHVLNLSLMPLNAADRDGLGALLGEGPVSMLSRGFGHCHIASAGVRSVWRVRYFNSMDTLILDTIEVVDLPEAARATAEDYADSVERLDELLGWLREGWARDEH